MHIKISYSIFSKLVVLLVCFAFSVQARAVPSFARQTGENCVACHTSFPELTPFGREFKLNGYTLGERQWFPVAAMAQISTTSLAKSKDANGSAIMAKEGTLQFDFMSVFLAGKINDHIGGFVQWTYSNNGDVKGDGSLVHHSQLDNTDLRVIERYTLLDKPLVVGLNLNNNPGVQDVWNSSPAWGFPYNSPNLPSVPGPSYGTIIDGGLSQQVAGLGGYFWWDRHLYGELSFYGTANKMFRFLSAGQPWDTFGVTRIDGRNNPYWRLAWNQEWGADSLMLGTYGMQADVFPDPSNPVGPTDRFTDTAFDIQYQHISDPSILSLQSTFIHESQDWKTSFLNGATSNAKDNINTFKIKASYLYDRMYGLSIGLFNTTGSNDALLYQSNASGITKPDSRGYVAQVDYNPIPNVHVSLQYIGFTKLDGASKNIDGLGRNASDNNTLFLNTWFAF